MPVTGAEPVSNTAIVETLVAAFDQADQASVRSRTYVEGYRTPTSSWSQSSRIRGIHHVRVCDGRIVEHWQGPDIHAMLLDMGLFPPTAQG